MSDPIARIQIMNALAKLQAETIWENSFLATEQFSSVTEVK